MKYADLIWQDNQAQSEEFGDIYFSRLGGLDESRHIFLELNNLKERFSVSDRFAIAELGFGTGLNFLLAWKLWLEVAPKNAKLDFVSSELFPMRAEDMRHALALWPEIIPFSEELIAKLPLLIEGSHRISFAEGRINLTLLYGDALKEFSKLAMAGRSTGFDCWFMDGFSPQKNPQMWSESLIELLSSLTKKGGTLATFSVAGFLRRSLQQQGWKLEKVAGFGRKRESLKAIFGKEDFPESEKKYSAPWFSLKNIFESSTAETSVVVVGAGLAGCWSAYCLARQGFNVTLIERETTVASKASGNPAALSMPYLSLKKDTRHSFYTLAFDYCRREIDLLEKSGAKIERKISGLTHLQEPDRVTNMLARLEQLSVPPELAVIKNQDSLFYPFGSILNPKLLCEYLVSSFPGKINLCLKKEALSLSYTDQKWHLKTEKPQQRNDILMADIVVVANSYDALSFSQTNWMPLSKVRGEIILVEDPQTLINQQTPICGDSYLIPLGEGRFLVGASYNQVFLDPEPSPEIQKKLFEQSQQEFGIFSPNAKLINSRVAFRASTYDRLPYVGPVLDMEKSLIDYKDFKKGFARQKFPECSYLPGLYVNLGHGSRGLVSAPLCAETISSFVCGSPLPLSSDLIQALLPNRWLIRQLARGREIGMG